LIFNAFKEFSWASFDPKSLYVGTQLKIALLRKSFRHGICF